MKLAAGQEFTHGEVIEGLRAIRDLAIIAKKLREPSFVGWPHVDAIIEHLAEHGLPDPSNSHPSPESRWVSVDHQLPDADITVLIANPGWSDPVTEGYLDGDTWRILEGFPLNGTPGQKGEEEILPPTHWMQLPDPPTF